MQRFSPRRRIFLVATSASLVALTRARCKNDPTFKGTDISGTSLGKDMAMVDETGAQRTVTDYQGKVMVVFFGFTHCPDICPTAMAELAGAMQLLKEDADNVQVLMITVD